MTEYSAVLYKRLGEGNKFSMESKPIYDDEKNFDVLMETCYRVLFHGGKTWPKYHFVIEKNSQIFGAVKYVEGIGVFFEKNVRPWGHWLINPDGSRGRALRVINY